MCKCVRDSCGCILIYSNPDICCAIRISQDLLLSKKDTVERWALLPYYPVTVSGLFVLTPIPVLTPTCERYLGVILREVLPKEVMPGCDA